MSTTGPLRLRRPSYSIEEREVRKVPKEDENDGKRRGEKDAVDRRRLAEVVLSEELGEEALLARRDDEPTFDWSMSEVCRMYRASSVP